MTEKTLLATKQLIDATWVLTYQLPDDNINKTRKEIGEPLEIIIIGHYRDDEQYQSYDSKVPRFRLEEAPGRIVTYAVISTESDDGNTLNKRYRVRNRKYVFSYLKKGECCHGPNN